MKTLNVLIDANMVIDGMVANGFCECDQKLTTECDHRKHPRCIYARGQIAVERKRDTQ